MLKGANLKKFPMAKAETTRANKINDVIMSYDPNYNTHESNHKLGN